MLVRCDEHKCVAKFLVEMIYSEHMRTRFDRMVGGTTNPHLNVKDIRSLLLALPVAHEQKRILSVLLENRSVLQEQSQSLAKLRSLKTGLMQDLLTGKVRVTPLLKQSKEAMA